ncbi:PQQ-binding-like beta-propeller repeat protein [Streptomyces sp. NPDC048142]|uniref:outer membrane protein assembly factor BamB family protein n=1 Tax=Streptomyces sp. NPDC048142 TaxID=3365501 RepID=UPI00370F8680
MRDLRSARMRRVVLSAVAAALLATGCTGQGEDGEEPAGGKKAGTAVALSRTTAWDSLGALGVRSVEAVAFDVNDAVVVGSEGELGVVDADTGTPRWIRRDGDLAVEKRIGGTASAKEDPTLDTQRIGSMTGMDSRPVLVARTLVLAPYESGSGRGVVALERKGGAPRWRTELPTEDSDVDDPGDRTHHRDDIRLLAGNHKMALVAVVPEDSTKVVTYALDGRDGKILWKRAGAWVYDFDSANATTVLGEQATDKGFAPEQPHSRNSGGWVLALNAKTGEERWNLKSEYPGYRLRGAVSHGAVLAVQDRRSESNGLIVGTRDGRRKAELDHSAYSCREDSAGRRLACSTTDSGLLTFPSRVDGGPVQSTVEPKPKPALSVEAVHADRVYLSGGLVTDLSGRTVRDGLPGQAAAVSDRHVAFRTESEKSDDPGLKVFRVAYDGKTPSEPTGLGKASVRPLAYTGKPEWSVVSATRSKAMVNGPKAADLGLRKVTDVTPVGDTLVYSGSTDNGGLTDGRLVALDPASGAVRWTFDGVDLGKDHSISSTLNPADDLGTPGVAAAGDSLILVRYYDRQDGVGGTVALSVEDGGVVWKRAEAAESGGTVKAADADSYAVEFVERQDTAENRIRRSEVRVYDLKSGELTATRKDARNPYLYDGTVTAEIRKPGSRAENTHLVGFTAKTGKQKWRLGDHYQDPAVAHVTGDGVAVITHAAGSTVIYLATGAGLAGFPAQAAGCHGDGPLIVCQAGWQKDGLHPVTIELAEGEFRPTATVRQLPSLSGAASYTAVGDRLFRRDGTRAGVDRPVATFDARGRKVSGGLPGLPIASDDQRVYLLDGKATVHGTPWSGDHTVTVHRRD